MVVFEDLKRVRQQAIWYLERELSNRRSSRSKGPVAIGCLLCLGVNKGREQGPDHTGSSQPV